MCIFDDIAVLETVVEETLAIEAQLGVPRIKVNRHEAIDMDEIERRCQFLDTPVPPSWWNLEEGLKACFAVRFRPMLQGMDPLSAEEVIQKTTEQMKRLVIRNGYRWIATYNLTDHWWIFFRNRHRHSKTAWDLFFENLREVEVQADSEREAEGPDPHSLEDLRAKMDRVLSNRDHLLLLAREEETQQSNRPESQAAANRAVTRFRGITGEDQAASHHRLLRIREKCHPDTRLDYEEKLSKWQRNWRDQMGNLDWPWDSFVRIRSEQLGTVDSYEPWPGQLPNLPAPISAEIGADQEIIESEIEQTDKCLDEEGK